MTHRHLPFTVRHPFWSMIVSVSYGAAFGEFVLPRLAHNRAWIAVAALLLVFTTGLSATLAIVDALVTLWSRTRK